MIEKPQTKYERPEVGLLVLGILLLILTFVGYMPVLRGGFTWDDDEMITNNPIIKSRDGLRTLWFTTQAATITR
jgi:hypothetical protein